MPLDTTVPIPEANNLDRFVSSVLQIEAFGLCGETLIYGSRKSAAKLIVAIYLKMKTVSNPRKAVLCRTLKW